MVIAEPDFGPGTRLFYGIENPDLTNNSAAYLQGWLQVFKQDMTMVVKAASQAQNAVDFILDIQFKEI